MQFLEFELSYDGTNEKAVLAAIEKAVVKLDAIHREHGGSGLEVVSVKVEEDKGPFAEHEFTIGDRVSIKGAGPEDLPLGVVLARQLSENAAGVYRAYLVRLWRANGQSVASLDEGELLPYEEAQRRGDEMYRKTMGSARVRPASDGGLKHADICGVSMPQRKEGADEQ